MTKKLILIAAILTISTFSLFAQAPPHPPSDAGSGGGPVGSGPMGAPIDGGIGILLLLAAGYAVKKVRNAFPLVSSIDEKAGNHDEA